MKRSNRSGSNQDSTLKEAGSMLFFTSIVFLMFLGYPSILNTYNAFQNEFAESQNVPAPIPVIALVYYGGVPLQFVTYGNFWFDQESPQYDFGLFPTASADTVNHKITLNADRIRTINVSGGDFFDSFKPCQDLTASYGAGYPATRRMVSQGQTTCAGYFHTNVIGEPNIMPDLGKYIDDVIWRFRQIQGASGAGCNTDAFGSNGGMITTFGGSMTAPEAVDNSSGAKFSTSTSGCASVHSVFPTLGGAGMGGTGDQFYRDLISSEFYPNGDSIDIAGIGMIHSVTGLPYATRGVNSFNTNNQNWIEFDLATIPINHTNGLWQMKEHSKYPTGTMEDCKFERLGDSFNIRTGDDADNQGQCVIFKVFAKGNVHFEDNFETGFAHVDFDENEWQSIDFNRFDINNATGRIEISVSDTNINADGIRFNHEDDLQEQQWVARVNFTNNVMVSGDGTHDVFFTVANSGATNRLSHFDALSMSWTITATTGEKRFVTYISDGDASQDIDDGGAFLNATDQGSAMDFGCIEIVRDGREATFSFWTNMACSGTPKDTLTRTFVAGTVTDARYWSFHYSDQLLSGTKTGSIDMEIDSIQIWNGVNEVPTTPFGEPTISANVFVNGSGSNEMRWFIDVLDGKHDNTVVYSYPQNAQTVFSEGDFEENKLRRNVVVDGETSGQTNHRMGLTERDIDSSVPVADLIEIEPFYDSGREDFFTVFIGLEDNSTDGSIQMNITDITVGDQEFDFSKPDVRFHDHVIPPTTATACGSCTPEEVQPLLPELDLGFVDTNQTTVAPIVAPALPPPESPVSSATAIPIDSIELNWIHDGINTTGYRIYRSSTESADEILKFNTGILGTTNAIGIGSASNNPSFHAERFLSGSSIVWTGEIITRVVGAFNTGVSGNTQNGELRASIKGSDWFPTATNTADIANSTTSFFNNTISTLAVNPSFTTLGFDFIGDDLKNITSAQNVDFGVGFTWGDFGSDARIGQMSINEGDSLTSGSGESRYVFVGTPVWSASGGRDLRMEIYTLNQTLLSSPAIPFVNDTGSLDLNFTDTTTIAGNSYFYAIVPLNGDVEQGTLVIVNATEPIIPDAVTFLNATFNETTQLIDLNWSFAQNADGYKILRTSTESGDEKVLYNFDGTGSPQTQILSETPADFTANTRWGTTFVNEMVSRITMNNVFNSTGASGILKGAIFLDADQASSDGDFTIITNSTTFRDPSVLAIPSDTAVSFKFIGTDLINLTSSVTTEGSDNIGIGVSWDKTRVGDSGTITIRSADGVGGLEPRIVRADVSVPFWGTTNGQDLKASFAVVNQTKLENDQIDDALVLDTATTAITFIDTTILINETYFYKVVPLNVNKVGVGSPISNATTVNSTAIADPPTSLVATTVNRTAIDLTWVAGFDGGAPITGYEIERESPIAGGFSTIVADTGSSNEFFNDTGLTPNTEFNYRVSAINSVGTSTPSNEDDATTDPITFPNPIIDLSSTPVGDSCTLDWTLPLDNGGSPINGHRILFRVDGGSFIELIANTTTATNQFNHTSLVIGSTYEYDTRSLNAIGEALGSNIPSCIPEQTTPPDPPTALGLQNVGADVQLDWTAPSQFVTGYKIERKIEAGAFEVLVADTASTSTTFTDTTIPALGTEVTYRVRSLNTFGESAPSGEATITTLNPPNMPTLTAVQDGSMITLTWTEPTSAGNINGYKIERRVNFGGFSDLVSNTTNTLLTIDDGAVSKPNTYGYRVSAHDDIPSTGDGSNVVDVVFGSHQEVKIREQDGSGYKGFGDVIISNSTFSQTKAIDSLSNVVFSNLASGLYNYTFKDMDDFVLNKTINDSFPSALTIETFTINALVFDVDCPATVGSDLRIKMNYTNIQDIVSYPSTPVCDSSDKVSWSTTWDSGTGTASSQMVADFISARFQTNADNFLVSLTPTSTIYSDPLNRIISSSFNITTTSPTTINFDLFLGEAPPSSPSPSTSPSTSSGASGSAIPSLKIIFEDRLSGLTLLSLSHMFIQPNDVIDGTITVGWNGESGMRVNRIDVGEFTDLIRFTTTTPFMLASITEGAGETARTEAQVDYKIFIPQAFCDEDAGILLNCLERELIIIPVTFTFEFQGQEFIGQTEVILDAREVPIDIVQLQVIGLGIVVIFSAFVGNAFRSRFKKKNVRKRKIKKKFDSS